MGEREAAHRCARDSAYRQVRLLRGPSPCFEHGPLCCDFEDLPDNLPGVNSKMTAEVCLAQLERQGLACQGSIGSPCCIVLVLSPQLMGGTTALFGTDLHYAGRGEGLE